MVRQNRRNGPGPGPGPDPFTSFFDSLCKSRFRRWITALDVSRSRHNFIHLLACVHQLPRLQRLAMWVDVKELAKRVGHAELMLLQQQQQHAQPQRQPILLLPPTLTSLDIQLDDSDVTHPASSSSLLLLACAIHALPHLQFFIQSSMPRLPVNQHWWGWRALYGIRQLRHLIMPHVIATPLVLHAAKQLPLHSLTLASPLWGGWSVELLAQLLTPPHQLHGMKEFNKLSDTVLTDAWRQVGWVSITSTLVSSIASSCVTSFLNISSPLLPGSSLLVAGGSNKMVTLLTHLVSYSSGSSPMECNASTGHPTHLTSIQLRMYGMTLNAALRSATPRTLSNSNNTWQRSGKSLILFCSLRLYTPCLNGAKM